MFCFALSFEFEKARHLTHEDISRIFISPSSRVGFHVLPNSLDGANASFVKGGGRREGRKENQGIALNPRIVNILESSLELLRRIFQL